MPPDLHLHPERLAAHAVAAAQLSEELRAALRDAPPEGVDADEEQVHAAVHRAVRELAALGAALAGAAAGYDVADRAVARSWGRVLDGGPP